MEELKVGKWYKRKEISKTNGWLAYTKLLTVDVLNNQQSYNERINGDGEYIKLKRNSYCTFNNFTLLTDLSEIIPFLPKNHPDIKIIHEIW